MKGRNFRMEGSKKGVSREPSEKKKTVIVDQSQGNRRKLNSSYHDIIKFCTEIDTLFLSGKRFILTRNCMIIEILGTNSKRMVFLIYLSHSHRKVFFLFTFAEFSRTSTLPPFRLSFCHFKVLLPSVPSLLSEGK